MDFSELSGLVLVIVGAVLFVTAVQLYTFWASEAVLASVKKRVAVSYTHLTLPTTVRV